MTHVHSIDINQLKMSVKWDTSDGKLVQRLAKWYIILDQAQQFCNL